MIEKGIGNWECSPPLSGRGTELRKFPLFWQQQEIKNK
jgi:hypothetical protein